MVAEPNTCPPAARGRHNAAMKRRAACPTSRPELNRTAVPGCRSAGRYSSPETRDRDRRQSPKAHFARQHFQAQRIERDGAVSPPERVPRCRNDSVIFSKAARARRQVARGIGNPGRRQAQLLPAAAKPPAGGRGQSADRHSSGHRTMRLCGNGESREARPLPNSSSGRTNRMLAYSATGTGETGLHRGKAVEAAAARQPQQECFRLIFLRVGDIEEGQPMFGAPRAHQCIAGIARFGLDIRRGLDALPCQHMRLQSGARSPVCGRALPPCANWAAGHDRR